MELRDELSINSDPALIADARGWLRTLAAQAGMERRSVLEMELALTEACARICRQSYRRRDDGRIDLSIRIDEQALTLTVRDYGEPGGRGAGLIRRMADRVHYAPADVGTCLVMVKERSPNGRSDYARPA